MSERKQPRNSAEPLHNEDSSNHETMKHPKAIVGTSSPGIIGRIVKRTIDIVLSLPVVFLILPPVAVLVRLVHWKQSPGALFFQQKRCGLHNRPFTILKFRTMNESCDTDETVSHPEARVFPLGHILRKTKLDEIPQFVNVLGGSMSIVGPRPHHFEDCAAFGGVVENYTLRTITKPGITGLAQITEYRGDFEWNCTESRVKKDLDYIRTWSPVLDLTLIVETVLVIGRKSVVALARRTPVTPTAPAAKIHIDTGTPVSRTATNIADERRAA